MTLKKKYEIACRALYRVGCEHWHRECQKVLRRIGELGRLNRERHDRICRFVLKTGENGEWGMCVRCPKKKFKKCTGHEMRPADPCMVNVVFEEPEDVEVQHTRGGEVMAQAHFVKRARKDYPEDDIKKGDSYWWWAFMVCGRGGPKHRSKKEPRPSQLTQSDFLSTVMSVEEDLSELHACMSVDEIRQAVEDA